MWNKYAIAVNIRPIHCRQPYRSFSVLAHAPKVHFKCLITFLLWDVYHLVLTTTVKITSTNDYAQNKSNHIIAQVFAKYKKVNSLAASVWFLLNVRCLRNLGGIFKKVVCIN